MVHQRRLKILHVAYSGLGGHGSVLFSLLDSSFSCDFESSLLFVGTEELRQEYADKAKSLGLALIFLRKRPGLDIRFLYDLFLLFRSSDADIFFLHGSTQILPVYISNLFAKKKRRVLVREIQANHLKTLRDKINLTIAMFTAHDLVFLSKEFLKDVLLRYPCCNPSARMSVIPNGVDVRKFSPKPRKPYPVIIGMQGRMVKIKDHATLVRAFAYLVRTKECNLRLQFAGDGECLNQLKSLVKELEIESYVDFLGVLAESDLIDFLQSLAVYVHATFGESLSTALLQAMACGLPIVASNVDGVNNMILHGTHGILVAPLDPVRLAEAISTLIDDTHLASELASNSYQTALNYYSHETMAKGYVDLMCDTPI